MHIYLVTWCPMAIPQMYIKPNETVWTIKYHCWLPSLNFSTSSLIIILSWSSTITSSSSSSLSSMYKSPSHSVGPWGNVQRDYQCCKHVTQCQHSLLKYSTSIISYFIMGPFCKVILPYHVFLLADGSMTVKILLTYQPAVQVLFWNRMLNKPGYRCQSDYYMEWSDYFLDKVIVRWNRVTWIEVAIILHSYTQNIPNTTYILAVQEFSYVLFLILVLLFIIPATCYWMLCPQWKQGHAI